MPSPGLEVSGRRNVPVVVEQPSETGLNAAVTWTMDAGPPYWVEMTALGGVEVSGLEATRDFRMLGAYRTDITPRSRLAILATTRKLQVVSAFDPDGRTRDLLILARETV